MDFLILRPLSPKTGQQFFEGGMGVCVGGVNSFRSEGSKQCGDISRLHHYRSNGNTLSRRILGRPFEP